MSSLENLKNAKTIDDLSKILGFKSTSISFLLYKLSDSDKYHEFDVRKKSGGIRKITAPDDRLKNLQSRLANLLSSCVNELEKQHGRKSLAHGFKEKHSIHSNAKVHKSKRYILNIDIKDFFPSINFGRVRGFFIKNQDFLLNDKIATLIAQIACYKNELPQGSPCSPIISNLIAHILDVRLVNIAKKYGCKYSRYADDITMSTNKKNFPKELAYKNEKNVWVVGKNIENQVIRSGFNINADKTRVLYADERQTVTGLVVNRKVNVRKEYYKLARAMAHSLFKSGNYTIPSKISPVDIKDTLTPEISEISAKKLNRLEGILNHIHYTLDIYDLRTLREKQDNRSAIWELYRKFIYFRYFGLLEKPLIICEGITDSTYLKLALKMLQSRFPSMIQNEHEKIEYKIAFLKYSKHVQELLHLSGGTCELAKFVGHYKKMKDNYPAWSPKHPVIILTDNDKGKQNSNKNSAAKVFSAVKEVTKLSVPTVEDNGEYYHINDNLYLVKTPHIQGETETFIEKLFEESLFNIEIDGKKFCHENSYDNTKFYGKKIFSEKVVRANFRTINFDGFIPLLERIETAINHYHCKNKI